MAWNCIEDCMEDSLVRLGLLMDTAQSQQELAAAALARLNEHTRGLDAVVRETISHTLLEELQSLADDSRDTAQALRELRRALGGRLALWSGALATLSAAVPLALSWWLLPTPAEVAALRTSRAELAGEVARLTAQGGRVQLRRCGDTQRLCVRVERTGPVYGESGDFLVVKGY
jgi:uncharacterized protein involved in exopolysaccharide biosynthesis